jgi:hypothetical protein
MKQIVDENSYYSLLQNPRNLVGKFGNEGSARFIKKVSNRSSKRSIES